MTYSEITAEIQKLDSELDDWYRLYRSVREQLCSIDQSVMELNKKKWILEKQLIKVTICPPHNGPKARSARPKSRELKFDIKDLTQAEIERILAELRQQKAEEEDDC